MKLGKRYITLIALLYKMTLAGKNKTQKNEKKIIDLVYNKINNKKKCL